MGVHACNFSPEAAREQAGGQLGRERSGKAVRSGVSVAALLNFNEALQLAEIRPEHSVGNIESVGELFLLRVKMPIPPSIPEQSIEQATGAAAEASAGQNPRSAEGQNPSKAKAPGECMLIPRELW